MLRTKCNHLRCFAATRMYRVAPTTSTKQVKPYLQVYRELISIIGYWWIFQRRFAKLLRQATAAKSRPAESLQMMHHQACVTGSMITRCGLQLTKTWPVSILATTGLVLRGTTASSTTTISLFMHWTLKVCQSVAHLPDSKSLRRCKAMSLTKLRWSAPTHSIQICSNL